MSSHSICSKVVPVNLSPAPVNFSPTNCWRFSTKDGLNKSHGRGGYEQRQKNETKHHQLHYAIFSAFVAFNLRPALVKDVDRGHAWCCGTLKRQTEWI